eukprot:CAMPEP_0172721054 /NCGR_PEP_ID=MMETSP1074-20121228/78227_1 /TAXON_ID=2916 /ORGANISM="Ceratium fusus, Strain PA161109" /LENGTH=724 /DNA_ID=CAMNT_0013546695 /DNA_START=73 /DNA_END=2247 /DNA_ORIENTATION=+
MASCLRLVFTGISLVAIATATTSLPFDCSADYTDCWECLQRHWSKAKLQYCCKHEKKGCAAPKITAVSNKASDPMEGVDCGGEVIRGVAVDSDAEQGAVVASCRAACFQHSRCGAWSLNETNDESSIRRCWLHRDCSDRKTDHRAISGLMSRGGTEQVTTTTTKRTTTRSTIVPIINVDYPEKMPENGLDGVLVDTNCWGQDIAEIAVAGANDAARSGKGNLVVAACRQACIDHEKDGCTAWTLNYGSAGMQGRGHCWLKAACTGSQKDTRAISGSIIEKESSKDAKVIDGGSALKRMEERSQQTKNIVGGVVGAGVGALAVGILGGVLGKRASDQKEQRLREQQTAEQQLRQEQMRGVGGTRGMGGNNLGAVSTTSLASTTPDALGLANGSANSTAATDSSDGTLVVPDTSLREAGIDAKEHTLMWWWIPLLLLLACLLICLGIWLFRKKAAAKSTTRDFKSRSRKRGGVSGINVPPSPASSACSEAPMLDDVTSPKTRSMQQPRSQTVAQESASMPAGGDLFDAIDANHDGVIDKEEFDRAMFGAAGARQGGSASMLAGGSASMLPGGSASMLAGSSSSNSWWQSQRQQQRPRSVTPPRVSPRPGSPSGRWMVYDGASASMSVGGSASMSPGASVSFMPAGASVSVMPTVSTTTMYPIGTSVSVVPPVLPVTPQGAASRHSHMLTTATVGSPSKMRSLTPPPSFGRPSMGLVMPHLRTPPLL